MSRTHSLREALGSRDPRAITAASTVDWLAQTIVPLAAVLAVVSSDAGNGAVGLVTGAPVVGLLVGLILLGGVPDRFGAALSVQVALWVRACLCIAAAAAWLLSNPVVAVAVALTCFGIAEGPVRSGFGSLIRSTASPEQIVAVNGAVAFGSRMAGLCGPALAALLATSAGPAVTALVAAVFEASAALLVGRLRRLDAPAQVEAGSARRVRSLLGSPTLRLVLLVQFAQALVFLGPMSALMPLVAESRDQLRWYAAMVTFTAVGGLIGAFLVPRTPEAEKGFAAFLGLSLGSIGGLSLALDTPLPIVLGLCLVAGVGLELFWVLWASTLQSQTPADLVSRAVSLDWLCSLAPAPLGIALSVWLASGTSASTVLATGCVLHSLIAMLPLMHSGSRRMQLGFAPSPSDQTS